MKVQKCGCVKGYVRSGDDFDLTAYKCTKCDGKGVQEDKEMKNAKILSHNDYCECDVCDKIGECVAIETFGEDYLVICKNCLEDIIKKM